MKFKDLYRIVEALQEPPVGFDYLRKLVNLHHTGVGTIDVYAIKYPDPNYQAHYKLIGTDRTSPYEDEFILAEIRYCDGLDKRPNDRRYALTKELMHVFDSEDEVVDSREKFVRLLKDIQNQPITRHESPAFQSELNTRWMAAIILCPKHLRDKYLLSYRSNDIRDFELAEKFRIPDWVIPFIMDDYYEEVFEIFVLNA